MLDNITTILASFTSPVHIGTDPKMMLYMFPLLAVIALVYKATKLRVLFLSKFFKESALLFATLSIVMIALAVVLHITVKILTE